MDMRRPHHRRKGERDGSIYWGGWVEFVVWVVIFATCLYVSFMGGRYFEVNHSKDTPHPASIAGEYKAFRIPGPLEG